MSHESLCLLIACSLCGAQPSERCQTKTGRDAGYPHSARSRAISRIWLDGFHEGQRDAVAAIDDAAPWSETYIAQIRQGIAS